ncbi:MAG: 2-amino-4-hydroxy-6-hydroxymethyldihydropteridine diphosphokinase [Bacteroidota bacterium]
MDRKKQQYFIALGSNIHPEDNIISMLNALFNITDKVDVSEIMRTEPVGLKSDKYFLNTVVRIETDKDRPTLKSTFNLIEESLGRDRSNLDRKYKDRTADLDILFSLPMEADFADKALFDQEGIYITNPLLILLKHLNYQTNMEHKVDHYPRIKLSFEDTLIGLQAVTLHPQLINK